MKFSTLLPASLTSVLLITIQFSLAATVPKDIFILAGQSNMAGRGGVLDNHWDGVVPPECQPNPSILRLGPQLSWEVAHEPLHIGIDQGECGVGPGIPFANEILRSKGSTSGIVGLVPCARSATKISRWAKGSTLYNELVRRANASLAEEGAIRAVLWYQGESDTGSIEDADAYKGNMEKLILDLRTDLNIPSLLVIQVALASGYKFLENVRKAQQQINLPNVKCVDAMGLALNEDKLHLSTPSQIQLGQKLAQAFLTSASHNKQKK